MNPCMCGARDCETCRPGSDLNQAEEAAIATAAEPARALLASGKAIGRPSWHRESARRWSMKQAWREAERRWGDAAWVQIRLGNPDPAKRYRVGKRESLEPGGIRVLGEGASFGEAFAAADAK